MSAYGPHRLMGADGARIMRAREMLVTGRDVRAYSTYGSLYVEVAVDRGEHHMTNRAHANRVARELGLYVRGYVGDVHYRNGDGYPTTARRYALVDIDGVLS